MVGRQSGNMSFARAGAAAYIVCMKHLQAMPPSRLAGLALAGLVLAALTGAAFGGWVGHGPDILSAFVSNGLAWCF